MKKNFKNKKKLIFMSLFVLIFLTGCKSYVNPETNTILEEFIIYPSTTIQEALREGWFEALFIWPSAQFINFLGSFSDAGIAIILATVLVNTVIGIFSIKSQITNQKMQEIQPEMQNIQKKYEGKTDDASRMMMAQEMQQLYKKYNIKPFSTLLTSFAQLPVMMAFYYAVQRASVIVNGTFLGINLTRTPSDGLNEMNWAYIIIWLLMVVLQVVSMKVPEWLAKQKNKVKINDSSQQKNIAQSQMKMLSIMSTVMIGFISYRWPIAMSFYWAVSSIVRIVQTVVIDKFFVKNR